MICYNISDGYILTDFRTNYKGKFGRGKFLCIKIMDEQGITYYKVAIETRIANSIFFDR